MPDYSRKCNALVIIIDGCPEGNVWEVRNGGL